MIGSPGGGKSSFLNTVFAAFGNRRWIEHAKCADTGETGKQITQTLKRLEYDIVTHTVVTLLNAYPQCHYFITGLNILMFFFFKCRVSTLNQILYTCFEF